MPEISIIVPVYNSKKYLHRCIDSILTQTYTDFELLLIDDGSKDKSGDICDEYALKDSRIRVFHKENGGVSSARNLGLDNAKGKWIAFVDSDDFISSNFCEILLDNEDEDLVICSFETFGNINDKYQLKDSYYSKEQLSHTLNEFLLKVHLTMPWGKIFKKSVLDLHNIKFPLNISSMEDTIFVYDYMLYINSIKLKSNIIYYYRSTELGLSSQNISIENAIHTMNILGYTIKSLEKEYDTDLSYIYYHAVDYIYIRVIRFIKNNSSTFFKRMNLIKKMHLQLPSSFLKEYLPTTIGIRGKVFYILARNKSYLLLSLYSYCVSI